MTGVVLSGWMTMQNPVCILEVSNGTFAGQKGTIQYSTAPANDADAGLGRLCNSPASVWLQVYVHVQSQARNSYHLGYFADEEEAAKAYDKEILKVCGLRLIWVFSPRNSRLAPCAAPPGSAGHMHLSAGWGWKTCCVHICMSSKLGILLADSGAGRADKLPCQRVRWRS